MDDDIIKEKYLENYPKPVSLQSTEKIVEQMKNNICKINLLDGSKGTGFFCKISYNNNFFPVFITNNHVINEEILEKQNKILISMNKKQMELELKNKIKYTNKEYDITIIEIKENRDKINNFLELDENILNNASNIPYIKSSLYILQYEGGNEEVSVSYGILKNISYDIEYEFEHLCCTDNGSSGSPIFNLNHNKIIGIHVGTKKEQINKGIFLNFPIKDFIKKELNKVFNINNNYNNMLSNNFALNQQIHLVNNQNLFSTHNNFNLSQMYSQNTFFNNLLMNQNNYNPKNNINNNIPPKESISKLISIKQFTYVPMIGLKKIWQ